MSLWLFNIFIDGCMKEFKVKVKNVGINLKINRLNVIEIEGPIRRGRPVVRWKDRVKE